MAPEAPPPSRPEKGFDGPARLSYGSYLKVPQLLELQQLQSKPPHHDELQFIIIHQTYELWFKLMLFELESVRQHLFEGNVADALATLQRVHAVERVLVPQIHVLESMTPVGFLGFRDHLRPASGFQSVQFREVEVLSGLRDAAYVEFVRKEGGDDVREVVERRLAEPSLREAMHVMLAARGLDCGFDASSHRCDEAHAANVLVPLYRTLQPRDVYVVVEALVEHDQLVSLWRHHHVAMVERLIGTKTGTGGSPGASYLRSTTRHRFYPELWAVRGALAPEGY